MPRMTPYTEVFLSYWNLHVRRRLWAQDLQVMADVVGILVSLRNEHESRLVFSFLGGVLAWTARAAGRRMGVKWRLDSPYVLLDPEREWFRLWLLLFRVNNNNNNNNVFRIAELSPN